MPDLSSSKAGHLLPVVNNSSGGERAKSLLSMMGPNHRSIAVNFVPYFDGRMAMYLMKGDTNMSYEVKNVKTFVGMEGKGYNATLYRDGVKIAFVIDEGNGGETNVQWLDYKAQRVGVSWQDYQGNPWTIQCTPEQAKTYEFIRGKTMKLLDGKDSQISMDIFLGSLMDDFENSKRFKRLCKNSTLFRIKGDNDGVWRTVKAVFSKRIKDYIVGKYGDQVETIMNETLGQVAA